jgi:hypothetical protein
MNTRILGLLFILLLSGPALAEGTRYSGVIEDLPLMAGMIEVPSAAVTFDTPEGRIAQTGATVDGTPSSVSAFYAATLPTLGWQGTAAHDVYARGAETLTLNMKDENGTTSVQFSLSPGKNKP